MKICAECKYHKKEFVPVSPTQMAPMLFCLHPESCDPVNGEALTCNVARQGPYFCTMEAKYFEPTELIQVAK